jgi:hypothetical protein
VHVLLVTHSLVGATHAEHAELTEQLRPALDAVPGLVSLLQLENPQLNRYGALFVFDARSAFDRFVASELYAAVFGRAGVADVAAGEFRLSAERVVAQTSSQPPPVVA